MVLMTLGACADSENTDTLNPTPSGQLPLQLEATMEDFNRADDTVFNEGDRVGLYLFTPQTYIDNALLTYSEGSLVSQQPLYWHEDSEVAATLVAYYPYNSAWNYATQLRFAVQSDQSTQAAYTASDLMTAETTSKPTQQPVTLPFRHALSKVIFRVNNQTGKRIDALYLSGVYAAVTLDVKQPSSLLPTGERTDIRAALVEQGSEQQWQLITAPQSGVKPTVRVVVGSKQYRFNLDEAADFSAGKQRVASLTLTEQSENLSFQFSATIEDWEAENDLIFKEQAPEEGEEDPNAPISDGLSYIFDMEALPEIHVTVSEEQWNELLTLFDRDANTDEYIHCDASFTKEGRTHSFTDAGLRLRGNTSRRRPEGDGGEMHNTENPNYHHVHFMLNLRKFQKDDEHELGGVRKIHLKWHKDDPCYARELFCYDLFRRYGIWTALKSSYCRLWVKVGDSKEAYYGVYAMLEAVDERFLKAREGFGGDGGFLWKCGWSNDFGAGLDNTEDNRFWHDDNAGTTNRAYCLKTEIEQFEAAKEQIKDFILKLQGKTGDSFKTWIQQVTDVELLLKTYAVNVAVGMWDDYWCNQNNYYIYFSTQDKYDYQFFFIPYDYDNTLGTSNIIDSGRQNPLNWDGGDTSRCLIEKLLQYDEWRAVYLNALRELCSSENLMSESGSIARIQGWHRMIGEYVSNDTGEDMEIKDRPAGWGNHSEYRLLESSDNNYFRAKKNSIPQE